MKKYGLFDWAVICVLYVLSALWWIGVGIAWAFSRVFLGTAVMAQRQLERDANIAKAQAQHVVREKR